MTDFFNNFIIMAFRMSKNNLVDHEQIANIVDQANQVKLIGVFSEEVLKILDANS